jgi:hypothetical protein
MAGVNEVIIVAIGGGVGYKVGEAMVKAGKYHMENYERDAQRQMHERLKTEPFTILETPKPQPWAKIVTSPIGEPATYTAGTILGIFIAYIIIRILKT